jgi:hypothetical protein
MGSASAPPCRARGVTRGETFGSARHVSNENCYNIYSIYGLAGRHGVSNGVIRIRLRSLANLLLTLEVLQIIALPCQSYSSPETEPILWLNLGKFPGPILKPVIVM